MTWTNKKTGTVAQPKTGVPAPGIKRPVAPQIRLDAGTTLYHGTRVSEDKWWERELSNSDKDGSGLIFFTVTQGKTPKQGPECHVISYTTKTPLTGLKVTGVNKAFYRQLIGQHRVDALRYTCSPNGEELRYSHSDIIKFHRSPERRVVQYHVNDSEVRSE